MKADMWGLQIPPYPVREGVSCRSLGKREYTLEPRLSLPALCAAAGKRPRFSMENGSQAAPPNGESGAAFMHRVCAAFEAFVERLMRQRITESVLITHGGVIMTILSAYGLPRASFYDWMTESGCGYSLRITPGLWMRSMVAEVYTQIPVFPGEEKFRQERIVLDLSRMPKESDLFNRKHDRKDIQSFQIQNGLKYGFRKEAHRNGTAE